MSTSTRALVGAKWVGLGALLQRAFQMGAAIVRARLLVPEDFGVFAVVSVTIDALNVLKELGMPTALIRLRSGVDEAASTFFYASLASAGVVCCATWLASPHVAAFVGSPLVTPMLRVMSLKTVLESSSIVQRTLALRELSVSRFTRVVLTEAVLGSSLAIVLAASGFGVWSLVCGALGGSLASASLWWNVSAWRPTGRFSPKIARQLIGFGSNVSVSIAIEGAVDSLTRATVGRWQGIAGLGYHDLAMRLAVLPIRSLTLAVAQQVAMPAMCQVQSDLRRMASWYLASLRAGVALTAPLAVSLVALPDFFVIGVCGSQWAPAVPLVRLLGTAVLVVPLVYTPRAAYVAAGRVDLLMKLAVLQAALLAPAAWLAARHSLEAVCAVQIGVLVVVAAASIAAVKNVLGLSWRQVLAALRVPVEGVTVQALVLLGVGASLRLAPTVWSLAVYVTPGLLAYAAVLCLRQPELVAGLVGAARRAAGLELSAEADEA